MLRVLGQSRKCWRCGMPPICLGVSTIDQGWNTDYDWNVDAKMLLRLRGAVLDP